MSIEFYIQGHRNGEEDGVALCEILNAFGKSEGEEVEGLYRLIYDAENSCEFSVTCKNGLVTAICIFRPCGHEKLYESIFDVLRSGPYVLFAPGGNAPIIVRREMAEHLPDGMAEALGEPVVVTDAKNISAALFD